MGNKRSLDELSKDLHENPDGGIILPTEELNSVIGGKRSLPYQDDWGSCGGIIPG